MSRKTRYSALFNGGQSSLDNYLEGVVGTAVEHRLNAALLFRREMDRHGGYFLGLMNFSVGEKLPATQVDIVPSVAVARAFIVPRRRGARQRGRAIGSECSAKASAKNLGKS